MIDQPLVSVLILTYNQERYISQAISCALAQNTVFPFEIVVGEDCSTDRTRDIVQEFQQKYPEIVRVVTSDTNVGMMKNFLRTVAACHGKYIAFCDGDDYWHNPEKLQIQVDFLENHHDYGMVHGAYYAFFEETESFHRWIHSKKMTENEDTVHVKLLCGQYPWKTSTICARGSLVHQVVREDQEGFDERFLLADVQLIVGMAARARVKYLDIELSTYRVLPDSACHSECSLRNLAFLQSKQEVYLHLWEKYKVSEHSLPIMKGHIYGPLITAAYWCRNLEVASAALKELAECDSPWTWRRYVYYLGLKYPIFDFFIKPVLQFRRTIRWHFYTRLWRRKRL